MLIHGFDLAIYIVSRFLHMEHIGLYMHQATNIPLVCILLYLLGRFKSKLKLFAIYMCRLVVY